MRGWRVRGGWGLEHLACDPLDVPRPGEGEVLLRMRAVSLNYRDLLMVRGQYNPRQPLPLVPCSDGVGVIEEVGPGVSGRKVGERVCPIFASGWTGGLPDRAMLGSTLGGPLDGTLREWMTVPAASVVAVPAHLSDAEASTLPCAAVTAWRALVTEGRVRAGSTILTLGTGGVSLFALQIARMHGARVVITSSDDGKIERARQLGAEEGFNYRAQAAWGAAVLAWSGGEGVDQVIEVGGGGTLDHSLRAVRIGGTISLVGNLAGNHTELMLPRVFMRGVRLQGVFVGSRQDFEALVRALAAHPTVRPVVDRVFPFEDAPRAFEHMAGGSHFGKIVLSIGDSP